MWPFHSGDAPGKDGAFSLSGPPIAKAQQEARRMPPVSPDDIHLHRSLQDISASTRHALATFVVSRASRGNEFLLLFGNFQTFNGEDVRENHLVNPSLYGCHG